MQWIPSGILDNRYQHYNYPLQMYLYNFIFGYVIELYGVALEQIFSLFSVTARVRSGSAQSQTGELSAGGPP